MNTSSEERHTTFLTAEMDATHRRWYGRAADEADPGIDQCGACRFWIPLAGTAGLDWGVCANAASPFDGTARFEHSGCPAFTESDGWATPSTVR